MHVHPASNSLEDARRRCTHRRVDLKQMVFALESRNHGVVQRGLA